MTLLVVVAGVLIALAAAAYAYWQFLLMKYPEPVVAGEVHTVKTADLWRIKLFRRSPEKGGGEPVLLCHGAFGNHFNFCMPAGESLVDTLVEHGYDCWLIDLRGCRNAVAPFGRTKSEPTTDDHLLCDLPAALDYIRRATGYARVHWIGHSMGGMLLYAYDQVFGTDRLASGVTLGSPIGFEGVPYHGQRWLLPFFKYGRPLVSVLLRAMVPVLVTFRPKSTVFPVNWDNVNPKIDGSFFFHGLDVLSPRVADELDSWASRKVWRVKNDEVDMIKGLSHLRVPLMAVYGVLDPLVPLERAKRFVKKLANRDKRLLVLSKADGCAADYSHVDLVFGRNGREEVYEPIVAWLGNHPIAEGLDPEPGKIVRRRVARSPARRKSPAKSKPGRKRKGAGTEKSAGKSKKASPARRRPSSKVESTS